AGVLWDLQNWRAIGERTVQSAREAGFLVEQHLHLNVLGMVATWRGDFPEAAARIAEADTIAEVTGTRLGRYAALQLAGARGGEAAAAALAEVEMSNAAAAGQGIGITWCHWVLATLYNGLGRYDAALAEAEQAAECRPEYSQCAWARVELIEA